MPSSWPCSPPPCTEDQRPQSLQGPFCADHACRPLLQIHNPLLLFCPSSPVLLCSLPDRPPNLSSCGDTHPAPLAPPARVLAAAEEVRLRTRLQIPGSRALARENQTTPQEGSRAFLTGRERPSGDSPHSAAPGPAQCPQVSAAQSHGPGRQPDAVLCSPPVGGSRQRNPRSKEPHRLPWSRPHFIDPDRESDTLRVTEQASDKLHLVPQAMPPCPQAPCPRSSPGPSFLIP